MAERQGPRIRRIVTGHDKNGKAVVRIDACADNHKFPTDRLSSTLLWATDAAPDDFLREEDAGSRILGTAPPAGGTRFCVLEIQPGNAFDGLHRTDTVDYVICMEGTLDMDLDDSCVTLNPGDVMVQRGTNHAWVNRGKVPARIAVVLVDGRPKRAGSVSGSTSAR